MIASLVGTARARIGRSAALAVALAAAAAGCGNPAVDVRVEQLGDEVAGVEPGPFHRPGQPCVLCHSTYVGASPPISVGGTIFATPTVGDELPRPVEGVKVHVTDAFGKQATAVTNCIGNFYFETETYDPAFPLHVEMDYPVPGSDGTTRRVVMSTRISRDGSCAGCHFGPRTQGSPGWVYCTEPMPTPPFPGPDPSCEGIPKGSQ